MVTERLGEKGKIIGLNMFPVPALPASEWEYNVWDVNTDGYVLFSSCLKYANPLMARYQWN
jgi:hypothetical protein